MNSTNSHEPVGTATLHHNSVIVIVVLQLSPDLTGCDCCCRLSVSSKPDAVLVALWHHEDITGS